MALEMLQQNPYLDAVLVPVGAGTLLSATAVVLKHVNPRIQIYGVETTNNPLLTQFLQTKSPVSAASSLSSSSGDSPDVGMTCQDILRNHLTDVLLVDESEVRASCDCRGWCGCGWCCYCCVWRTLSLSLSLSLFWSQTVWVHLAFFRSIPISLYRFIFRLSLSACKCHLDGDGGGEDRGARFWGGGSGSLPQQSVVSEKICWQKRCRGLHGW
jgi:hypothetical protein